MRKTYFSLSHSRMLAAEYPVGDPYGGTAFGEKNMGGAAFAAVVTWFEAASVATIISTVGTVLSVVGMVTGSQTLMQIGGVMSLVGGIGAMTDIGGMATSNLAGETISKEAGSFTGAMGKAENAFARSQLMNGAYDVVNTPMMNAADIGSVMPGAEVANTAQTVASASPELDAANKALGTVGSTDPNVAAQAATPATTDPLKITGTYTDAQGVTTALDQAQTAPAPKTIAAPDAPAGAKAPSSAWGEFMKGGAGEGIKLVGGLLQAPYIKEDLAIKRQTSDASMMSATYGAANSAQSIAASQNTINNGKATGAFNMNSKFTNIHGSAQAPWMRLDWTNVPGSKP